MANSVPPAGTADTVIPTKHGQSIVITVPATVPPNATEKTWFAVVAVPTVAQSLIVRAPLDPVGPRLIILQRRPADALMTEAALIFNLLVEPKPISRLPVVSN
jgi:hypothetical protein